jgi:hypothetical protein
VTLIAAVLREQYRCSLVLRRLKGEARWRSEGEPNIPKLERERNATALLAALRHKRAPTRAKAAAALGRLQEATAFLSRIRASWLV